MFSVRHSPPAGRPTPRHLRCEARCSGGEESVRPTWSSTPQPPAEVLAACLPLLTFSRPPTHLATGPRQDLPLSRTVIGAPPEERRKTPYVDRFACDWHRLADLTPGWTRASRRRNHGPGRTPCTDVSRRPEQSKGTEVPGGHGHAGAPPGGRDRGMGGHRQADRLEGALGLPCGRARGEHVVTNQQSRPRPARAQPTQRFRGTVHRAGQVRRPAAASRPAWSSTPGRLRSSDIATTSCPAARATRAARVVIDQVGSCPRARTTPRREGTGTSTTGPGGRSATAAATAWASSRPSGRRRASMRCSLWASTMARTVPAYSPAAQGVTSPAGTGVGQLGAAVSGSAAAHAAHRARPGRAQPTQAPPRSRSSDPSRTSRSTPDRSRPPRPAQPRGRGLWNQPA